MTEAQYLAWLNDQYARPVVLIEVAPLIGGVPTTLYLATVGYTTGAGDSPANTPYLGICANGIQYSEGLSLTGEASLSVGDIELHNYGGARDAWLTYVWAGTRVKAWLGDVSWTRADFRQVFDGVVANIDSKSRETLNLKVRDKLARLNAAATEHKLGGDSTNKDAIIPLAFGEVPNISPLLIEPTTLTYQVHDGAVESIFEVRDNGLPVEITAAPGAGTFRLNQAPAGAITATIEGDKAPTYNRTVASVIRRLVTGFGKSTDRFTADEIDAANFAAFDAAHPQPVGLFIGDRTNVLAACQQLAGSLGAQLAPSATGQLRLLQIALPPAATIDVTPAMMTEKSLRIVQRPDVVAAVKLGFCRNWTPQDNLQTALPAEHRDLFATEWLTETAVDAAVQALYHREVDPVQKDTALLRRVDAGVEAKRQLELWNEQRTVYEFEGLAPCLPLQLGDGVKLYNSRFGLAGAPGVVIARTPNLKNRRVVLQVLV